MSLTSLEATYNCDKIFLYYTAEGRIDFRELLKELSTELKTKIQMVQIGVRDESKMIGGLGHCGRVFCCKDFLKSFNPIVIDMAKDQDIPLNPTKISGVCGRLLCCLGYEHEQYKEMASELPNINQSVEVKEIGKGVVIGRDTLKQKVNIRFEDGTTKQFTTTDLIFTKKRREK
jgi:cell fate regulator YaaT (PSP1 superfamily)